LIVFVVTEDVPPSVVALHVRVSPAFGLRTWTPGSQPLVERSTDPGGVVTVQLTTTKLPLELPVYQPFVPGFPMIEYVTAGGAASSVSEPAWGTTDSAARTATIERLARDRTRSRRMADSLPSGVRELRTGTS
jgi:hypothetical protein